jgi:hypothetical protein
VYINFKMLKAKVLIIFFGTPVFSICINKRYKDKRKMYLF